MSIDSQRSKRLALTIGAIGAAGLGLVLTPQRALPAQTKVAKKSPAPPARKPQVKKRDAAVRRDNYAATAIALRHWQASKIQVYVNPAPDDTRSPDEVRALVAKGLDLWKDKIQTQSGALPIVMTSDPDAADIKISFVPAGSLSGGRIGVTDVLFTVPQQVIESAKIRLVEGQTDDHLIQSVAHETGHALGIQGHSDFNADLMYPYAHLPAAVTARDIKTIYLAYANVRLGDRGVPPRDQKYAVVSSDAPAGMILKPRSILRKSDF